MKLKQRYGSPKLDYFGTGHRNTAFCDCERTSVFAQRVNVQTMQNVNTKC